MQEFTIDKLALKGQLASYNIDNQLVNCILDSYKSLKCYIVSDFKEFQDVLDQAKDKKTEFPIILQDNEYALIKYVKQFSEEGGRTSRSATLSTASVIERSFMTLAFYYNKGIRSYMYNNTEFVRAIVATIFQLIIINAKKSYIGLSPSDINDIKLIVSIYTAFCLLGIRDKSELLVYLKQLGVGILDRFKISLFFNHFATKITKSKTVVHIIAELLEWNKVAVETLLINIMRTLGSTLAQMMLTCIDSSLDGKFVFAYKMSYIYFYYKAGIIHTEANVGSLNRMTNFEFARFLKNLAKTSKLVHYGRC